MLALTLCKQGDLDGSVAVMFAIYPYIPEHSRHRLQWCSLDN